jgi:NADH dehydrogenase
LPNVRFALAEVKKVDLDGRVVESADMAIPYDFLILSVGSTTHFFGVPGAAEHAFPLKDMDQAIALRNHLLCCFERAAHESDADRRQQILTFVIVGGGPTGVEFAGALAELIHRPLVRDYPNLDFCQVRVVLVEAKDSVLPDLPQRLRAYASARLRRMGIEVRVRAVVSQVARDSVRLKDGSTIRTETLIWTAGVRGVPQAQAWGLATARNGRAVSLPTLQVPDHPEAYVIGDLAHREESGRALPMIAPVAIQQGVAAAQNIARQLAGHGPVAFHYRDPGLMVTIGRNAAVACVRGRCFTGFSAWLLWLSVHIYKLIGFRNRLLVLINWAWDYFLYERAVRLILPSQQRELAKNQRT